MSFHRGMAGSVALFLALTAAACSSDDEPDPRPTRSTSASPSPAWADEAPGVDAVPLAGDDDVPISWAFEDGVDDHDAAVDVARRTLALLMLVSRSPEWATKDRLDPALAALATGDAVGQLRGQRASTSPPDAGQPVRLLVLPPRGDGDRATAWLCLDYLHATSTRSKGGVLAKVGLMVTDGVWKATDYDLHPDVTTALEDYQRRCRSPY